MPKEGERPYENLTSYKNSLKMAWSDRRMAKEEVDLLGRFRGRFGVSREEHAAIEGLVFLELALEAGSCRDEDGAGHWFDMISTHDPPYEDAHRSYGEYLSRHGRDAESARAYERADELASGRAVIPLRPEPETEAPPEDGQTDAARAKGRKKGADEEDEAAAEAWDAAYVSSGRRGGKGAEPGGEHDDDEIWNDGSKKAGDAAEDGAVKGAGPEKEDEAGPRPGSAGEGEYPGSGDIEFVPDDEQETRPDARTAGPEPDGEVDDQGIMACPKCHGPIIIMSSERPLILICPDCGAKGRLKQPGIPNPWKPPASWLKGRIGPKRGRADEDAVAEDEAAEDDGGAAVAGKADYGKAHHDKDRAENKGTGAPRAPCMMRPCPKCGEPIVIPSPKRPLMIRCSICGACGRITK